ncbi:MAG: hypothetical protein NTV04_13155 [Deltaproteobacteria bacterium]|nr:hypothetical protein [Deltaproteobacteria bacterium]
MLANALNSERAVRVRVQVVRAFIRLRETMAAHADLARKLAEMEKKYDTQFKMVFETIRQLRADLGNYFTSRRKPQPKAPHPCPSAARESGG